MTDISHKIIDPHLHLFNLQQGHYAWLKPQNPPFWPDKHLLNKNFVEADISLPLPNQLAGFVHIEAGFDNQQPWREIDWLQQHCTMPFKSVAFADIMDPTFAKHIGQLQQRQSVVGIRYILDEQALAILSSTTFQQNFLLLEQVEFSFDAQLSLTDDKAIEQLFTLANKHKTVKIIINHAGNPPASTELKSLNKWKFNLQKLAQCENIAIKLSGWEMSNRAWQPMQAFTVIQDCIATFGSARVMLASNFPLCLLSMSYAKLWNSYADLSAISPECFNKIIRSNAAYWYKF